LWTAAGNGRGPAIGFATQTSPGGQASTSPIYECQTSGCRCIPIRVSRAGSTRIRLLGTGIRYAGRDADVRVKIGGILVPVVAHGPAREPGVDDLTLQLPSTLHGLGETDLICSVNGRLSNVVRIDIGPSTP
jgi:hypothetical protein